MIHKQRVDQLQDGVRSLLTKNGYTFSEEDKTLLEDILIELERMSNSPNGINPNQAIQTISLLLKFLKFFGIDDFTGLF
ncbi:hypothetical protein SAMN05443543_101243 [Flavobacterium flevense]|uniref:Uncharacterized protein n=1 Tax=Flavobacterium flevense TaxID=983 RepID=A0A4Y4AXZ9_9FLAO|nr:hypothetical protein FFL01_26840 [Flavobacterium flevense]SHL30602.1 hypothetical protein SAMN05443543_101243 [Flavobacterium flevense]